MVFDPTPCFVFDNIFSDFWCLSGVQLASYSRKTGHKKASQKGTNQHENATLWTCPEAPREAASRANFSKQETTARAQNAVRVCFSCVFLQECLEMLFELASIANVPTICSKKLERIMSRAHHVWSDTPLAKAWRICGKYYFEFSDYHFFCGDVGVKDRRVFHWRVVALLSHEKEAHGGQK